MAALLCSDRCVVGARAGQVLSWESLNATDSVRVGRFSPATVHDVQRLFGKDQKGRLVDLWVDTIPPGSDGVRLEYNIQPVGQSQLIGIDDMAPLGTSGRIMATGDQVFYHGNRLTVFNRSVQEPTPLLHSGTYPAMSLINTLSSWVWRGELCSLLYDGRIQCCQAGPTNPAEGAAPCWVVKGGDFDKTIRAAMHDSIGPRLAIVVSENLTSANGTLVVVDPGNTKGRQRKSLAGLRPDVCVDCLDISGGGRIVVGVDKGAVLLSRSFEYDLAIPSDSPVAISDAVVGHVTEGELVVARLKNGAPLKREAVIGSKEKLESYRIWGGYHLLCVREENGDRWFRAYTLKTLKLGYQASLGRQGCSYDVWGEHLYVERHEDDGVRLEVLKLSLTLHLEKGSPTWGSMIEQTFLGSSEPEGFSVFPVIGDSVAVWRFEPTLLGLGHLSDEATAIAGLCAVVFALVRFLLGRYVQPLPARGRHPRGPISAPPRPERRDRSDPPSPPPSGDLADSSDPYVQYMAKLEGALTEGS